jgi:hypothetical protein
MQSGGVRSAEQYCAATMELVSIAALTACKQRRICTGGKTNSEVDPI